MKPTIRERVARKVSEALAPHVLVEKRCAAPSTGVLSITFDDFPKTAWEVGGPLLAGLGAAATYYVSGSCRGRSFAGAQQYDDDDLAAAYEAGHEIGCHTYDHLAAPRHSIGEYLASIERNGRFLRERLPGWSGRSFAYPYGLAPLRARRVLVPLFAGCRAAIRGINGPCFDASLLRATGLERWRGGRSDITRLIESTARQCAWLIVFTHDVRERPSDFGCTPAELEGVIRHALAAGLEVRTVASVLLGSVSDHPSRQAMLCAAQRGAT